MQTLSRLFTKRTLLGIFCALLCVSQAQADDQLPSLQVGATTFSNVTVTTKTSTDIYFNHSYGFGNAKVRDIDRETLRQLGYKFADDEPKPSVFNTPAITNFVADPRVQRAEAMLAAEVGELLDKFDDRVIYGFVGAVIFLHLLYSFLSRLICVKAGTQPGPLIWVPFFQQIPLLKAGGLSGWWLLPSLIPPIGLAIYVWWSFQIAKVRGKSWLVGLLLLLPVTNILAFLYLALSGTGQENPLPKGVISLASPPPLRKAA